MMAPAAGEPPLDTILYRLDAIEARRAEDRRHFDAVVATLRDDVRDSIGKIAYVSKEQFADYRAAAAEAAKETREIAASARSLAQASLWVLIVAVVSGIVALAFQVAS